MALYHPNSQSLLPWLHPTLTQIRTRTFKWSYNQEQLSTIPLPSSRPSVHQRDSDVSQISHGRRACAGICSPSLPPRAYLPQSWNPSIQYTTGLVQDFFMSHLSIICSTFTQPPSSQYSHSLAVSTTASSLLNLDDPRGCPSISGVFF